LCSAPIAGLFEYDGELVHARAHHDTAQERGAAFLEAARHEFPMPPTRGSINSRAILDRKIVHIRDVQGSLICWEAYGHSDIGLKSRYRSCGEMQRSGPSRLARGSPVASRTAKSSY
jgi:hypothetical protein